MKIGRRAFILTTALCGAAPVFAKLLSPFEAGRSGESPMPEQLASMPTAGATEMNGVEFRIDGWNRHDGDAVGESPTAIWISINQSWRSGWR